MTQQSIFWGQRAKIHWMTNADDNTRYFNNSVKVCQHRNKVRDIKYTLGNIFSSQNDVENCFLHFFKNLLSSSSVHNSDFYFNALSNDLHVLTDMDREILSRPISKGELYITLKSMPWCKSPGPDGLNVEFYIYYWNQLGDHFFNVVSHFF